MKATWLWWISVWAVGWGALSTNGPGCGPGPKCISRQERTTNLVPRDQLFANVKIIIIALHGIKINGYIAYQLIYYQFCGTKNLTK